MYQYRGRTPEVSSEGRQPSLFEDFGAIAARLRLKDMSGRRNPKETVHTVEDEYRSYTNGALTNQGEDPLKFWDVCVSFVVTQEH